jgi:YidC/Oxa1 family membrane protein insertase
MDRNSAIGLTLIAGLLLLYFYFFSPTPTPVENQPLKPVVTTPIDSARQSLEPNYAASNDSLLANQYGSLASLVSGREETTKVENNEMSIVFSNRGKIKSLELKNFKSYYQKPLMLVDETTNSFRLTTRIEGKEVDLHKLYYQGSTRRLGDSTVVEYTAQLEGGRFIKHVYSIPSTGFKFNYRLQTKGLGLESEFITYQWTDRLPLVEKDLADSRNKTTINFYSPTDGFDGLSETSQEMETESLTATKWVAIRQKFFVSSIIAKSSFSGGEISTLVNAADTATVKDAAVKLFISKTEVDGNGAQFSFYFGPNDYSILPEVAQDFSRNLYYGWPPVLWVNKFLIVPIFNFLESFIGNYGLIIIILVLIVKLILAPLSYKSYLGMAKMKLLKPELDVIKEKYGDNMTQIQAEQMKLYQQAGVNPFSGCIPLLLQMPILFAMFYFFPVSIELRQQPFLWAEDLSTYDSVLNLPFTIPFYGAHVSLFVLLMTASQLVAAWQNNQLTTVQGPMKSMQYLMPVIFMFVLNNFSAGLSFYYFVSNLATFAQQAIIKRFVDEDKIMRVMDEHKKKMAAGGGNGKKSSFMSKLEDAMKASQEAKDKNKKK